MEFINENYLTEMAMRRGEAIDNCEELGEKFTEHFNTITKLGKEDVDFKHHCQELQTWYDRARKIKLKETKKLITKGNLWDWFFTVGQNVEDVIEEPYQELYEDFCFRLLSNTDKTIYEVLSELLS